MDNNTLLFQGQCSNMASPTSPSPSTSPKTSDEDVLLASSCPKKRAGRKKFKETRHPVFRGVRQRNGNRWVCEVRTPVDNSRIWLGTYPTAEMAARAHDVAALALRGNMACLNFADSAWRLPVPASTDARDIQRAAAEAGELFRHAPLPPQHDHQPPPSSEQCLDVCSDVMVAAGSCDNSRVITINDNDNDNDDRVRLEDYHHDYMDEEALFNMPRLIDNMAQGLLIPPPINPLGWEDDNHHHNECEEVSLWNHSNSK